MSYDIKLSRLGQIHHMIGHVISWHYNNYKAGVVGYNYYKKS